MQKLIRFFLQPRVMFIILFAISFLLFIYLMHVVFVYCIYVFILIHLLSVRLYGDSRDVARGPVYTPLPCVAAVGSRLITSDSRAFSRFQSSWGCIFESVVTLPQGGMFQHFNEVIRRPNADDGLARAFFSERGVDSTGHQNPPRSSSSAQLLCRKQSRWFLSMARPAWHFLLRWLWGEPMMEPIEPHLWNVTWTTYFICLFLFVY